MRSLLREFLRDCGGWRFVLFIAANWVIGRALTEEHGAVGAIAGGLLGFVMGIMYGHWMNKRRKDHDSR